MLDFSGKVVVLMDNVLLSGIRSSYYNSSVRISNEVLNIVNSVGDKNIYCIILADNSLDFLNKLRSIKYACPSIMSKKVYALFKGECIANGMSVIYRKHWKSRVSKKDVVIFCRRSKETDIIAKAGYTCIHIK